MEGNNRKKKHPTIIECKKKNVASYPMFVERRDASQHAWVPCVRKTLVTDGNLRKLMQSMARFTTSFALMLNDRKTVRSQRRRRRFCSCSPEVSTSFTSNLAHCVFYVGYYS